MATVENVTDGIIKIMQHWTVCEQPLLSDAAAGTNLINIQTTKRYFVGDELIIKNTVGDKGGKWEGPYLVTEVNDLTHITISAPLKFNWNVSDSASVQKSFNGNRVKNIYFDEPDIIALNNLPAITVKVTNNTSEWATTRTTKERFNVEIAVFNSGDTFETGSRVITRITNTIEKALKANLYPLTTDYDTITLLSDINVGDIYIKVSSTDAFKNYQILMLEDIFHNQEFLVKCVIDENTLLLSHPVDFDFLQSNTVGIIPHTAIYNSWPAEISYGKIWKGTLLKAATISYFLEASELQLNTSNYDTKLS